MCFLWAVVTSSSCFRVNSVWAMSQIFPNPNLNSLLPHIKSMNWLISAGCRQNLYKPVQIRLTHWGRVTHICVRKLTITGSDNGLSPGRRQAIIWTNVGILLIRILGTNFSEILSEIHAFSFKKMHLKMSSAKWRPFSLGLNVLISMKLATHTNYINSFVVKRKFCQNDNISVSLYPQYRSIQVWPRFSIKKVTDTNYVTDGTSTSHRNPLAYWAAVLQWNLVFM